MRTPQIVLDTMHATFLARALFVVTDLGVPDLLADGPMSCASLADRLGVEPVPLHQVLRAVATTGLLRTEPGPETGAHQRFSITEPGQTLREGHPSGTRDMVLTMQGELFWNALRVLPERVGEGRTGPEIACGKPFFDLMSERPAEAARFNRMMIATSGDEPAAVARAYDFSEVGRFVDVGGGIGTVLLEVLRRFPHVRGVLVDLPGVIEQARRNVAAAGVSDRCEIIEGDFLDSLPAGADAYLLSRILHDWDDETCSRVLGSCARAMTRGSRLLVVEKVLPDDDEPHLGKRLDLIMAALTHGRERTAAEYAELLAAAGLRVVRQVPTGTAACVIEAELR
ncbi:methyltransferase [Saccharopolyspora sp. TS4A08]|uniref:Methyltransferase n=1 Tax=Saccharopolyspora ipomoeae TaxID=3042027 RepID=A0ABT6PTU8_9PSEU|nr:methyltransferase [Saccharopolyspora sp. TS4A08]MDI2031416.1 methyltransferase [Saccharopolyspora sp. TS4A08]